MDSIGDDHSVVNMNMSRAKAGLGAHDDVVGDGGASLVDRSEGAVGGRIYHELEHVMIVRVGLWDDIN